MHLMDALDEPMHHFVVHCDLAAEDVQQYLIHASLHRPNVHIMTAGRGMEV